MSNRESVAGCGRCQTLFFDQLAVWIEIAPDHHTQARAEAEHALVVGRQALTRRVTPRVRSLRNPSDVGLAGLRPLAADDVGGSQVYRQGRIRQARKRDS